MNQAVTFLSDGGDTVRDLQMYLNPQAEHLRVGRSVPVRLERGRAGHWLGLSCWGLEAS
jgi:hypothetical protein